MAGLSYFGRLLRGAPPQGLTVNPGHPLLLRWQLAQPAEPASANVPPQATLPAADARSRPASGFDSHSPTLTPAPAMEFPPNAASGAARPRPAEAASSRPAAGPSPAPFFRRVAGSAAAPQVSMSIRPVETPSHESSGSPASGTAWRGEERLPSRPASPAPAAAQARPIQGEAFAAPRQRPAAVSHTPASGQERPVAAPVGESSEDSGVQPPVPRRPAPPAANTAGRAVESPAPAQFLRPPAPESKPAEARAEPPPRQSGGVHIGSIDIRIEPPPVSPPPPRAAAQPSAAPSAPLARGFASSFGLRQG